MMPIDLLGRLKLRSSAFKLHQARLAWEERDRWKGLAWIEALSGDHVGTASGALHAQGILRYERTPGESPSLLAHVGGISRSGPLHEAWISEARLRWSSGLLTEHCADVPLCIYRPIGLPPEDGIALGKAWESWDGTRYGIGLIPLFWADNLLARIFKRSNVVIARRLIPEKLSRPICSVGIAMKDAERSWFGPRPFLDKDPRYTDPDDCWDEWQAHPERWRRIFPPLDWPKPLATLAEVLEARAA